MASYNRIVMIGNLTRDPEYRQLPSGQATCRLGLAANRQFKNKQTGSAVQEVCFVDVEVWGAQAESCRQYLQKGRSVLVEGRLKFDTWEDQNGGGTRSKHSIVADRIVFLNSGASAEADTEYSSGADAGKSADRELWDQLQKVQTQQNKVKAAASKPAKMKRVEDSLMGDAEIQLDSVEFKDEPPFEDELPF